MTDLPATTTQQQPLALQRDVLHFGTLAEVMKFAEMIQHAKGAIPARFVGKPGEILATVMAGHELGIGPMASLRAFHVVEGSPVAHYSFWIARLKAAGYTVEWPHKSAERVTLKLTDQNGISAEETWDKTRAIKANLWNSKDNWKKYPEVMLAARCVTSLGRSFAAEVMFSAYELDEEKELREDMQKKLQITTEAEAGAKPAAVVEVKQLAEGKGEAISKEDFEREAIAKEADALIGEMQLGKTAVVEIMKRLSIQPRRIMLMSREEVEKLRNRLREMQEESRPVEAQAQESTEPDPDNPMTTSSSEAAEIRKQRGETTE